MTGALAVDLLMGSAVEVAGLRVCFEGDHGLVRAVDDVSLHVAGGEVLAVVGESGCGKSVLLKALLGLLRGGPGVIAGQVKLRFRDGTVCEPYQGVESNLKWSRASNGSERFDVSKRWQAVVERRFRPLRGRRIGLVLQNGRAALDPFYSVGRQLTAVVRGDAPSEHAEHWLTRLGFSEPKRVMKLYPHELSGGMAQRVMLAVVLAQEPEVLLLDEITTGLDVSLQASVLELLARLYQEVGFSAVLVTHDLGVARSLSSRVVIMRRGQIEQAVGTEDLFGHRVPLTPYADRLLKHGTGPIHPPLSSSSPDPAAEPFLQAAAVDKTFGGAGWGAPPARRALKGIDLSVDEGECLALVGESGSGKTTLTRVLAGLTRAGCGQVTWGGRTLGELQAVDAAKLRRRRTVLFQNPYTSLNPAMTARSAVAESLHHNLGLRRTEAAEEAGRRLALVGLADRADHRLDAMSGGERRRVGLLSVLQTVGDLLVLDEPTAGLDAEHRVGVRRLIEAARDQQPDRTILLVSHDIGFVLSTADRIVVLYDGRVVEDVAASDFLDASRPHHPYTQLLWDASRYVAGAAVGGALVAGRLDPIEAEASTAPRTTQSRSSADDGCVFRARCPLYEADSVRWSICERRTPALISDPARRRIACHGVRDADLEP